MTYAWHPAPKKRLPRLACIGCTHYRAAWTDGFLTGCGTCTARDHKPVAAIDRHPCALYEFGRSRAPSIET